MPFTRSRFLPDEQAHYLALTFHIGATLAVFVYLGYMTLLY